MSQKEAEFEKRKMQINWEELIERMIRLAPENSLLEMFPGIFIYQSLKPTESQVSVLKPAFCVIAQGSKDVLLKDEQPYQSVY